MSEQTTMPAQPTTAPADRNTTFFFLALAAQVIGIVLIFIFRASSEKVMFIEGTAVTVAAFLVGFIEGRKGKTWHWIFGALNLFMIVFSWWLIKHH
jgi:hypothetical protein